MNKLVFKKILSDYLIFFIISIVSSSIIVWVFQAVNYLDIIIDDGKGYLTYITYSLSNLPKIFSKLFPFILFFSFFYVLIKYENDNELLIFWNFGINKFQVVYFFLCVSLVLVIIQIFLTSFVVPNTLKYSRTIIKNSNNDLFKGFIKPKKFNDNIKGLTIYSDAKLENGKFKNIYIKKKTGKLFIGSNNVLELYNGQTINNINNKISKFKFQESDFSLNNLESNSFDVYKLQETPSIVLWSCLSNALKKNIKFLEKIDATNYRHNCNSIENIYRELYKRFVIPFYIPVFFLVTLTLILRSKEQKIFNNLKIIVFLINFLIIIFSESSLKLINNSLKDNFIFIVIPLVLISFLMANFLYQLKIKFNYK